MLARLEESVRDIPNSSIGEGLNREASERGNRCTRHEMQHERERKREREIRNIIFFFFFGNYFCLVSEQILGKVFRRVRGLGVLA